jgi:hypothetical protein
MYITKHNKRKHSRQEDYTSASHRSKKGTKPMKRASQANNSQYYCTHAYVGTLRPAGELAPLDVANMSGDARYDKKLP